MICRSKKELMEQCLIFSSSGVTGTHKESMVNAPGVITGRYGTIGEVIFFRKNLFWPLNTTLYVENFHGNDERFIYYFLKSLKWEKFTSASAVPGINRNTVHKEIVEIPDLESQRKIAAVLSAFDDKIDINQRINDNLAA
jgi:type I restriction enzyme S subunit